MGFASGNNLGMKGNGIYIKQPFLKYLGAPQIWYEFSEPFSLQPREEVVS